MGPSEARLKVFGAPFFKKARPCPYRRAAHEKKLGKQGPCPAFPGRWGSCPLSHGCRRASSPEGRAKSRLPLWGRCPPVGGGEGKAPAVFSHGLCGSAGELPSQSPNGDSSPKGGAKYVRYQKLAQSQVSPPPLGEVSCQRHDGEGKRWLASQLSGSHLPGTPPSGKGGAKPLFP